MESHKILIACMHVFAKTLHLERHPHPRLHSPEGDYVIATSTFPLRSLPVFENMEIHDGQVTTSGILRFFADFMAPQRPEEGACA